MNDEVVSAKVNFIANVLVLLFVAAVLFVPIGFVSLKWNDPVAVNVIHSQQGKLHYERKIFWRKSDWFGIPAFYASLTGFQSTEEELSPIPVSVMEKLENYSEVVFNDSQQTIYNTIEIYGDVTLVENNLEFIIKPGQWEIITFYYPDYVGCQNPPPRTSSEPMLNWTTEKPADKC